MGIRVKLSVQVLSMQIHVNTISHGKVHYKLLLCTRLWLQCKLDYTVKCTVYIEIKVDSNVANGYAHSTKCILIYAFLPSVQSVF